MSSENDQSTLYRNETIDLNVWRVEVSTGANTDFMQIGMCFFFVSMGERTTFEFQSSVMFEFRLKELSRCTKLECE